MSPVVLAAGIGLLFMPLQWLICVVKGSRLNLWLALLFAVFVFFGVWLVAASVSS